MLPIYWLIALAVLLIIEILTLGLTTIWFAGGALVAFFMAELGFGIEVQVIVFFAASLLLLYFTRPLAMKYINKNREKTNVDSLIGKVAVVTEKIDNRNSAGRAIVSGQEWTARSQDDNLIIEKDMQVNIVGISGVKLIVTILKEEKKNDE